MTKSPPRRSREALELVDEPALGHLGGTPYPERLAAPESFEDFYRHEYPRLLVLARALAGDLAAEDVAQESMLAAFRQWPRISELESPAGYVRGICAHHAVSLVRRRLAERRALRRVAQRRVVLVEALSSSGEQFWTAVRQLPRRQAQAAALFYALDLSVAEVAASLGCAEGTVKVHLSRARAQLATRLGSTEEQP
jgi:RNA polymerase sigma factor (sigma-70 family)